MRLAEKTFSRGTKTCPIRSDCRNEANRKYFDRLFSDPWEVFVIKRDGDKKQFDWFTLCCDAADTVDR